MFELNLKLSWKWILFKALRISMEESRLKQEADAKKASGEKMETDVAARNMIMISHLFMI